MFGEVRAGKAEIAMTYPKVATRSRVLAIFDESGHVCFGLAHLAYQP